MNQQDYLTEFKHITEAMYKLTEAKNHDYASDGNAFRNFQMVEHFGVLTTEQGIFTRMTDKMSRLAGYLAKGELKVNDEKITDTLEDLAVYAIILNIYLNNKKK